MTQTPRFLAKRQETVKELLHKASDHLGKIGAHFLLHLQDLPAEIRRDRHCFHSDKDMFPLLGRHLRGSTLDGFLQKHPPCGELVAFVFGGRYPRLIRDPALRWALAAADGTSSVDGPKFLASKRPRQQTAADDAPWKPKRRRTEDDGWVPPTEQERRALQAFDDFQTADDDPLVPPSARGRFLSRAELEALEMHIDGMHGEDGKVLVGTHLTFTLPPPSPSPTPRSSLAGADPSPTSDNAQHAGTSDTSPMPTASAPLTGEQVEAEDEGGRFMAYKGHLMEPPPSVLTKLKAYLSTPDVEQHPRWAVIVTDIQEYLAHLLQVRAGERWEPLLDEVVDLLRAHALYDDFHRDHPGLDYSLWDDVMKPRHVLRSPLGTSIKVEGGDTPSSSPLGDVDEFHTKDPIAFDSMMLAEPPLKESRDPFAYTRWHNRLRANVQRAADEAREATMAHMAQLKTQQQDGFCVMDAPRNWNGPVSATTLLDAAACNTLSDWTRLRLLRAGLQRTARRSPRPLLDEVNRHVALGLSFEEPADAQAAAGSDLVLLQKGEIDWLSFLCQPSLNDTSAAAAEQQLCRDDWKLAVLRKRIRKMQGELVPGGFGDGQRVGLRGFLELVNQDCDGPVKGHRFSMDELQDRIPPLTRLKVLRTEQVDGVQHIRRCPGDVHPEEAIRWPESNGARRRTRAKNSDDDDDDDMSPTVPQVMPSMDHVRTFGECLAEQDEIQRDAAQTVRFFRRIAYRLGRTLQRVAAEGRYHQQRARDPACRTANAASLRTLVTQWAADTGRAVVPPCRSGRVVASYRDVVLAAEPEAVVGGNEAEAEAEAYCRDVVRRNILREAAENKTMLWPLAVPRDSSVDGVAGRDGRTVLRREALWSFAHPSRTAKAPRFFDVNAWPLEVQSEETQAAIRAAGVEDAGV